MTRGDSALVPAARAPARDLRLTSSDGITLAATFRPGRSDRSPGVLLLHGVGASRAATAANAAWLASLGYATLTLDFRGHGQSTTTRRSFGLYEARDAAAGLAWLKGRQPGSSVAAIGISLGGAATLLGDEGPIDADALVLQAVYPDIRSAIRNRITARIGEIPARLIEPLLSFQSIARYGARPSRLSPISAVRRYAGPVLVIGGGADASTPPSETRALHAAVPGRGFLWLVPGKDHAETCDMADAQYRARIATFLAATVGTPAGDHPVTRQTRSSRS
jgi:pimeloyl-ACP methyl ester carboxylesterase